MQTPTHYSEISKKLIGQSANKDLLDFEINILQYKDVMIRDIKYDDLISKASKVVNDPLANSNLNDVNDPDYRLRKEIINEATINEVIAVLPEMSNDQANKLNEYIAGVIATIPEIQSYCQTLLCVAYLTKSKSEEERVDICEEIAFTAHDCLAGASGSLHTIQSRISGNFAELAIDEVNKRAWLSSNSIQTHAQGYFRLIFGGSTVDQFATLFPRSLTMREMKKIALPIAILDKEYFSEYAIKEMISIIDEENAKGQDADNFLNNLFNRLANHGSPIMQYLKSSAYGTDEDGKISSFFGAKGEDLRNQVCEIVKNNSLGSDTKAVNKIKLDVISEFISWKEKGEYIPVWLEKKIKEQGGFTSISSIMANKRFKEIMSAHKEINIPEQLTLQDYVDYGFGFEKINKAIQSGVIIANGDDDFKIGGLIGNPEADKILDAVTKYIEEENKKAADCSASVASGEVKRVRKINYRSAAKRAIDFGFDDTFKSQKTIAELIHFATQNSLTISRLSACKIISLINAVEGNKEAYLELMTAKPSIILSAINASRQVIKELGATSPANLLTKVIRNIENSSDVLKIVTNDDLIFEILHKSKSEDDVRELLQIVISRLNKEQTAKLFTTLRTNQRISIFNRSKVYQEKLLNAILSLSPEICVDTLKQVKDKLSKEELGAALNIQGYSDGTTLPIIVSIKSPQCFLPIWEIMKEKLSTKQIVEMLKSPDISNRTLPMIIARFSSSNFSHIWEYMESELNADEMRKMLTMQNNAEYTLPTIVATQSPECFLSVWEAMKKTLDKDELIKALTYSCDKPSLTSLAILGNAENFSALWEYMEKNLNKEQMAGALVHMLDENESSYSVGSSLSMIAASKQVKEFASILKAMKRSLSKKQIASELTKEKGDEVSLPIMVSKKLPKEFASIFELMKDTLSRDEMAYSLTIQRDKNERDILMILAESSSKDFDSVWKYAKENLKENEIETLITTKIYSDHTLPMIVAKHHPQRFLGVWEVMKDNLDNNTMTALLTEKEYDDFTLPMLVAKFARDEFESVLKTMKACITDPYQLRLAFTQESKDGSSIQKSLQIKDSDLDGYINSAGCNAKPIRPESKKSKSKMLSSFSGGGSYQRNEENEGNEERDGSHGKGGFGGRMGGGASRL